MTFPAAARILQSTCALPGCHAGPEPAAGLRLEAGRIYRSTVNARARTDRSMTLVVPGAPDRSLLYLKLLPPDEGRYRGPRMPYGLDPLGEDAAGVIRRWIESFPAASWGPPPADDATGRPSARSFHDGHLVNLPTTDPLGNGALEFRILHRFRPSAREAGGENLYGLDGGAFVSIGLTYGVTDRLEIGLRRTNVPPIGRDYELHTRWTLLDQGEDRAPLSVALRGGVSRITDEATPNGDRFSAQAIVARRLGRRVSLLLAPTYVARANNADGADDRGTLAVGTGAEVRLTPRMALTGEWIVQASGYEAPYQGGSLAFSIATARHVFQVVATNTASAHTDLYAPGGDLEAGKGHYRLGFSITRTFTTKTRPSVLPDAEAR